MLARMLRRELLKILGLGLIGCNEECMQFTQHGILGNVNTDNLDLNGLGYTNIVALGDSIMAGSNASSTPNRFIELFKTAKSFSSIQNGGTSSRGVWQMINNLHDGTVPDIATYTRATSLMVAMVGLNDIRRGGSASKTMKKIEGCYYAYLIKHLCSTVHDMTSGSVTRTGTHVTFSADSLGGRSGANTASYTTTTGAKWSFTFTGPRVAVMMMAQDGVTSTGWGTSGVYIDGVLVETFSHSGVWYDAISDGSYNNAAGPVGRWYDNLSSGSHTIEVIAQGTTNSVVNYFAVPDDPTTTGAALFCEIPYLNSTGYAIAPSNATVAISNQASAIIQGIVNKFKSYGYRIEYVPTNTYYNLSTGLDSDNIHPNNTGHAQINTALLSALA
jgi:lysophospholipase L1-like esterase